MAPRKEQQEKIAFVRALRDFGECRLALEFDGSFERYFSRHRTANWLYAVFPDRLESALPGRATFRFGWDLARVRRWERSHRQKGHDTYLYSAEAHGGSRCPITPSLLASNRARQGYVVLHEAWHSTLRLAGIRLPYALEEASGRVVGVIGALRFAERQEDPELVREARAQVRDWGRLAAFINRGYRRLARLYRAPGAGRERRRALAALRREADALRARMRSPWEVEELTREMNNALFFRYYDYTRHYPLALRVYRETGSLRRTMRLYKQAGEWGAIRELRQSLSPPA